MNEDVLPRICVIGIYFGKLPNYFGLWLKSLKYNDSIDFLLFTDQKIDDVPINLRVEISSLISIKQLFEYKLGFEVSLEKPYKCCDFRPAYGEIFHDYIKEYDYWGYCDFDMIFGDLKYFFLKYHINEYDRFLPMGHLGLYKNNTENNHRYTINDVCKYDYKHVFTDYNNYAFDEQGSKYIFQSNRFPFFEKRIFADISKIYKRFRLALDDINYNDQVFFWEKGKIFRAFNSEDGIKRDEFIYIHFKERGFLNIHGDCLESDRFFISSTGFYASILNEISQNDIDNFNPFLGTDYEKKEWKQFCKAEKKKKIKEKVSKILHFKANVR